MWVAAFVLYDFFYYWNHRCGHEISLFWAAHVVHHSSEDYNLTTALRQSSGSFFNFIFFIPLALLGVDPLIFISIASVNLVYQFWVHTQHVGKLGVLEWFMVTPSNHRVHHAQNQIYLDRNYGGVFIIWDRLFGSYQDELAREKPIYGVRKALRSWNPFFANIQVYKQLIQDSVHTKHWSDKVKVWFGRTGWRPEDVSQKFPIEKVDLSQFIPYNTAITSAKKAYCILQYVLIALVGVYLMMNTNSLAISEQITIALFVVAASVNIAWIMENRSIALWFEWPKNLLLAVGLLYSGLLSQTLLALGPIVASAILLAYVHIQHTTIQKVTDVDNIAEPQFDLNSEV
jgi:hypothetical protein